jgi:hypothetical protein
MNSVLAYIVVCCQALLALICVVAICLTLFYKNYSDPAILSALILLTGTLVGNLGSILGGPRQAMMGPAKTEITNSASNPVPVSEEPKP